MEQLWWLFLVSASILLLVSKLILAIHKQAHRYKNLPPSPPSFPIIGHLHLIKEPIHRSLQELTDKYGPILKLSFGKVRVMLVSSPSAVEECFSKNDVVFANRPHLLSVKHLSYDYTMVAAASYGPHWRNLRRLLTLEIFSTIRLNMFLRIRQDEVRLLLKNLYHQSSNGIKAKVEVRPKLSELSFNIIMRMVAGKRYFGLLLGNDAEEAKRFQDIIREFFEISVASNPGDFLSLLRWVDYKSSTKRIIMMQRKFDGFMQNLIDEHREKKNSPGEGGRSTKTMIDSMLSLQESEPEYYSDQVIKGIILALLAAGTDTSSLTIEWAMSLLLNNPAKMQKAKAELDNYVGHGRLVDEPDLARLPYIQNVINETLRLFPTAPLLLPHESSSDCTVGGYDVPPSTMLLINAWTIHRDPRHWDDPLSFKPERFENIEGEGYKFLPFGLGRRACPGAGLAHRVMELTLAALIQCFEWERVSEEEVDLTEGTGLTMPKAKPLEAICKVRASMLKILSEL